MDKRCILQLQTFPASKIAGMGVAGLKQYRKELIKVGRYVNGKKEYNVTLDTLNHWVETFQLWTANGNKVAIPSSHENRDNPDHNQGWVTGMFVEDNSLYGILELLKPELALVTDVSIEWFEGVLMDGKGNKYELPITAVALSTKPVVPGLKTFEKLSLVIGETNMEFVKKIAKALGLSGDTPTEESVMSEVEKLELKKEETVKFSQSSNSKYVVKMLGENRAIKLSNLLRDGKITPAVKDVITKKYVEVEALTLSMSTKADDGFDFMYDVLEQNHPINMEEVTGVQSLELTNQSVAQPNATQKDIDRRRKAAGLDS